MKYRNKTGQDLLVGGGQLAKAGAIIDSTIEIENPNFELVEENAIPQNQNQVPAAPATPAVGQPAAPITPLAPVQPPQTPAPAAPQVAPQMGEAK